MISNFSFIQKVKIHYTISGSGPCIVLLHGFAEDCSIWVNQIEKLQDHYEVIAIDLPGFGKSQPINKEHFSLDDIAELIHEFIMQRKLNHFIMIGHSLGGYVAVSYLKKYPEKLLGLGLFHSHIFNDSSEKIAVRIKSIEFIQKNGTLPFLHTSIPGLFKNHKNFRKEIIKLIESASTLSEATLIGYYYAMMNRLDASEMIQKTNLPILFAIGQYDQTITFKDSFRQLSMPNQAHVFILRSSAHMGMIEEPEKSSYLLKEFCDTIYKNHQNEFAFIN